MSVKFSLNPGVFGVSAQHMREELKEQGFYENLDISVVGGELTASVFLACEAETQEQAEKECRKAVDYLKSRYGKNVFTETHGTLWETVVADFTEKEQTFALAESCTGGLISKMVTDVSGSSKVFKLGVVAYHPDAKKAILNVHPDTIEENGAVSSETAIEMAEGARKAANATVGIGVTGYAGPVGDDKYPGGTVFVSLSDGEKVYVRMLSIVNSDRGAIRRAATLYALDMLRLYSRGDFAAIGVPALIPTHGAVSAAKSKKLPLWKRFLGFFTNFPKDPWGEKIRKLVLVAALFVMVFAGWKVGDRAIATYIHNKTQSNIDDWMNQGGSLTSQEKTEILDNLTSGGVISQGQNVFDWALVPLTKNNELVGRIRVGEEGDDYYVDELVVQCDNNEYYVNRSFQHIKNNMGTVFMDYRCNKDLSSTNTILYGHSTSYAMDVMFKPLHQYKRLEYLNKYPVISYDTVSEENDYKIFAVMIINTEENQGETFRGCYYVSSVMDYIDDIRERSLFDTNVDVNADDKILTISTCTYDYSPTLDDLKLIIMARKVRDGESLEVEPASKNPDTVFFDAWYDAAKEKPPVISSKPTSSEESGGESTEDSSSTESEIPSPEGRFELYNLALRCEEATSDNQTSAKAYAPFMSEFNDRVLLGYVDGEEPENGKIDVSASKMMVTYKPKVGFKGIDTFKICIDDGSGLRDPVIAEVTVYVGCEKQTGVTVSSITSSISVKAGKSGSCQIKATSETGAKLKYEIVPTMGLFSGTAEVDENGKVTYTSTSSKRYADTIKVLVTDEDGFGQIVQVNVNASYPFETEKDPTVSMPEVSDSEISSEASSEESSESEVASSAETSSETASDVNSDGTSTELEPEE